MSEMQQELNTQVATLPYIFRVSPSELTGLNATDAVVHMLGEYGTVLHALYIENGAAYAREREGWLYQAGFALVARSIEMAAQQRNVTLPAMGKSPETFDYYRNLTSRARARPLEQLGVKWALSIDEEPLLEAVETAYAEHMHTDGDRFVFYDGVVDAYLTLSEAARIRESMLALSRLGIFGAR